MSQVGVDRSHKTNHPLPVCELGNMIVETNPLECQTGSIYKYPHCYRFCDIEEKDHE